MLVEKKWEGRKKSWYENKKVIGRASVPYHFCLCNLYFYIPVSTKDEVNHPGVKGLEILDYCFVSVWKLVWGETKLNGVDIDFNDSTF